MTFEKIMFLIVGIGLTFTALAALVRIVRGPTILDRMVASDVLLTTVILALGADMVARGHTDSIPIMVAIAATATFATIVVSRYVKRRNEQAVSDTTGEAGHV
ncbi:monovalent cation/H+ antiporter complex subunit F [Leucobacter sp. G161]|uniref:monovalent cation/H+ antiporter complex subunit F n=1 Tax=Leucobacter sp. G161 TaxID=663704 RepID=UPI00073B0D8D|nr:monovalent cation/H+ antiporter complex subunit F [Leucobacter sp. G161]KUF06555.1 sodium:proton antiporter [Leucobacter sp. G161]